MSPIFDVVIPAHDAAATIEAAVASAFAQRLVPARVLVVADACQDDTAARARSLGAEVMSVDARSAAVARNEALRASSADWVAFLDADDLWADSWLEAAARAASECPNAGLLYGTVRELDENGALLRRWPLRGRGGDIFESLLVENFLWTSATIVRREAVLEAGLFEPSLRNGEDWDLWLRIAASFHAAPVLGHHVSYRRIAGSVSRTPEAFLRLRDHAMRVIDRAERLRPVPVEVRRRARAHVLALSAMRLLSNDDARAARIDLRAALECEPTDARLWALTALAALPRGPRRVLLSLRSAALRARARGRP